MAQSAGVPTTRRSTMKSMTRRRFVLASLATVGLVACGPASQPSPTAVPPQAAPGAPGAQNIVFWHAMSGVLGDAVNKMVEGYNKSQQKFSVEAIFQGTYDDAL